VLISTKLHKVIALSNTILNAATTMAENLTERSKWQNEHSDIDIDIIL